MSSKSNVCLRSCQWAVAGHPTSLAKRFNKARKNNELVELRLVDNDLDYNPTGIIYINPAHVEWITLRNPS